MSLEKIRIALPDDVFVEVVGEMVAPGLVIAPYLPDADSFNGWWMAVHVSTGKMVIGPPSCLHCVRGGLKHLLDVDWTRGEELAADEVAVAAVTAYRERLIDCVGDCTIPDGV